MTLGQEKIGLKWVKLKNLKPKANEVICSEFITSNWKWICLSFYRLLDHNNFSVSSSSSQKPLVKTETFVLMCHFNIDINSPSIKRDKFDFTRFFKNLITSYVWYYVCPYQL